MKPPSNDADRPNSGSPIPGVAKDGAPNATATQNQGGKPGTPSTPQGGTSQPLPPGIHVKSEPTVAENAKSEIGKSELGKSEPGKSAAGLAASATAQPPNPEAGRTDPPGSTFPKVEPGNPAQPSAAASGSVKTDAKPAGAPGSASATVSAKPSVEPGKPAVQSGQPGLAGAKAGASTTTEAGKPETGKADPAKPEFGRPGANPASEPPKTAGGPAQGAPRPTGGLTDGPIIDLKAKRVDDAGANAAKTGDAKTAPVGAGGIATGMAGSDGKAASDGKAGASGTNAKPVGAGGTPPRVGPAETVAARGPGFGSVATAGLLGGVIGAGLLFAVERAGVLGNAGDEARLNALDQRISGQLTGLDQRMASLSPRDAVAALDKRVAANEATLKPLPDAVKAADAAAKQALDRASGPATPAASTDGRSAAPTAQAAIPADVAARLDSLDQRVSALQEEPGREQPGDARLGVTQAGDGPKQIAALDGRVKALEDKAPDKTAPRAPSADLAPKLATLQGEVEARTKANAEADQALGQRLDALQKTLDDRVKAATEAVQTATQASRDAAEAGKTTAEAATKALDRRLQEQAEKIAALDKAVALRAEASTVQAALKVVTADRIAAALESGLPYAEPLATLRKLETGDASRVDALAPFAEKGAPTADQLANAFRPIADRIAAARKASAAKDVAANGDLKSRFLSIADSIVQVRKVDAPQATDAVGADPVAKVQAALDRGALIEASQAYEAMPQDLKAEAAGFGATLKARATAAQAAEALLSDAFKGLPTTAPAANP